MSLVYASNSRHALGGRFGLLPEGVADLLRHEGQPSRLSAVESALPGGGGPRVVVDATASEEVAAQHARWLSQGIHVVTACKLGQGTTLERWQAIRAACAIRCSWTAGSSCTDRWT